MEIFTKVFKQTFWQVIGKAVSIFATLVILGIVTRTYGQEGTGIFTLALTYLAFFFLLADLGLNGYILPRLSSHPVEANLLFNFRLWWSLVLVFVAIILTPLLPSSNSEFNVTVYFGAISILIATIFASANLIFQSKLRYEYSNLASSIGNLTVVPLIILFAYLNFPIPYLILATVFGWIIISLLGLILVKKLYTFRLEKINLHFPLSTLKYAWPLTLTLILNSVYFRIDAFILSSIKSFADVGIYNVAFQVFQSALTLPTFIMNSFYPLLIEIFAQSKHKFINQLKIALGGLFFLSILGMVFTYLLSPWMIEILAGKGFEDSAIVLRILSFGFPAYFLTSLLMWVFVLISKQKQMFLIYLIGLIFNVVLNLIFIPQYSYLAAAWVTGVVEYLILILQATILWKHFYGSNR